VTRQAQQAQRRAPGKLESEVLALLWAAGTPVTATDVQHRLSGDLAYTTVVTILSRLRDKGVVTRVKQGRSFAYSPVADEAGLVARQMCRALDAGPDRDRVLASFVSALSAEDERTLRALLRRTEGVSGGR
jgi:predicted transcriptional regulator